jgi:hypothetical protein
LRFAKPLIIKLPPIAFGANDEQRSGMNISNSGKTFCRAKIRENAYLLENSLGLGSGFKSR